MQDTTRTATAAQHKQLHEHESRKACSVSCCLSALTVHSLSHHWLHESAECWLEGDGIQHMQVRLAWSPCCQCVPADDCELVTIHGLGVHLRLKLVVAARVVLQHTLDLFTAKRLAGNGGRSIKAHLNGHTTHSNYKVSVVWD